MNLVAFIRRLTNVSIVEGDKERSAQKDEKKKITPKETRTGRKRVRRVNDRKVLATR